MCRVEGELDTDGGVGYDVIFYNKLTLRLDIFDSLDILDSLDIFDSLDIAVPHGRGCGL